MTEYNKALKRLTNALNANDYESARKILENDFKRLRLWSEYYFYMALISDKPEIKLDLYTKAIETKSDFLDAYINRGLVKNELGDYDGSINDYDKAIELDSRCALAYNNRGYTKYKKEDFSGALKDYNKAILLNPKLKIALDNKAKLLMNVCLHDDNNFTEKYYLSLGICNINQGNFNDAISDFSEAIKQNPNYDLAFFYKGVAEHNLGKNDDALESYTKSIELNKKLIDAYYNRGQLLFNDEPKKALDDFVTAIALDSEFVDAYYSIAAIQKKLGEYENAIKNLDKLLEINPDAVNAKALKKLILTKYLK